MKSLRGKLFIFTPAYGFCCLQISLSVFIGLCHLSRLFSLLPPSHFLISSLRLLRALWCAVKVTLAGLRWTLYTGCLCNDSQKTNKMLLPRTETSIYPDLDLAVIVRTDGQSKAHHTLGAKNKLKSARPCIPFQNQYHSGECVMRLLPKKTSPEKCWCHNRFSFKRRKGKTYSKTDFYHWKGNTKWWISRTFSPLSVDH